MALSWNKREHGCLGCGGEIADTLWRLGSILCHDCRELHQRVDPTLAQELAEGRQATAEDVPPQP